MQGHSIQTSRLFLSNPNLVKVKNRDFSKTNLHRMMAVHRIGTTGYTSDKNDAAIQDFKGILNVSGDALPVSANGASIVDAEMDLTPACAAALLASISHLPTPLLIIGNDTTVASGIALLYTAAQAKLDAPEAIRLAAVLGLPLIDNTPTAGWVSSSLEYLKSGSHDSLILKQMFDPESSTFTYLLADSDTKEAVLIDPVLEQVDRDVAAVEELGLTLLFGINTHCHADHITGTGLLKKRIPGMQSGIAAASGAQADVHYAPGDTITFGRHTIKVIDTPGHTDGCVSYYTTAGGGMVFTGDALLIRGCGRTDFQQGNPAMLYESVHGKLFQLPPCTTVYPAHDYRNRQRSSVIEEKLLNPRLTKDKDGFIKVMNELNLAYPKKIDVAVPANMVCGVHEIAVET